MGSRMGKDQETSESGQGKNITSNSDLLSVDLTEESKKEEITTIKKTEYIFNVNRIDRTTKRDMKKFKNFCTQFMKEGTELFKNQLLKWQYLQDEN